MTDDLYQKSSDHELRIIMLERQGEQVGEAVISINESLKSLVRIEERVMSSSEAIDRAFKYSEKLEERIRDIEVKMPGLVEVKDWVVKGVLSVVGIVFVALIGVVIVVG